MVIDQCGAVERPCTLEDLSAADEVFLASTVREVQPVAAIDDVSFPSVGPVTERLTGEITERIRSHLDEG